MANWMSDEELDQETRRMTEALNSVPDKRLTDMTFEDRIYYEHGIVVMDSPGKKYTIAALKGIAENVSVGKMHIGRTTRVISGLSMANCFTLTVQELLWII